jgi:hypothetical protein
VFRRRKSLDPLVVDQTAVVPEASIQDNDPGPTAMDLEALAEAGGDREALESGPSRISYSPGAFQPRKILENEPKDD